MRSLLALCICVVTLAATHPAAAQTRERGTNIEWWHPVVFGVGVGTLFVIDEPIRERIQQNRSDALDDIANVTKRFKDAEVFYVVGGGALALGLATQQPKVAVTGIHVLASYALSSGLMIGTKWITGRTRPSQTPRDPYNFDWFNGGENTAFPSGSAAVVFSMATTLADAIDRKPATIALYSAATLNAWARLNSDRHWLSDVALGALYGITAAKLVNGELTVFGLQPPSIWTDGRSTSMSFTVGTR